MDLVGLGCLCVCLCVCVCVCENVIVCEVGVNLGSRLVCVCQKVGPCPRPVRFWVPDLCVIARVRGRIRGRCVFGFTTLVCLPKCGPVFMRYVTRGGTSAWFA